MPLRKTQLVKGETYHVFNRSVHRVPIFNKPTLCKELEKRIWFYHFTKQNIRYSEYNRLRNQRLVDVHNAIQDSPSAVTIHAYCIMPNHFHLLVTQKEEDGIKNLIANFQSSFAQYSNKLRGHQGGMFENPFKSVHIETDEQFVHLSRYIHLNPITGYLVKNINELVGYKWSSLPQYIFNEEKVYNFVERGELLKYFPDREKHLEFVSDQIDYQRELKRIEHLLID